MQGVSLNATQILQREDSPLHIPSQGRTRSDLVQQGPSAAPSLKIETVLEVGPQDSISGVVVSSTALIE